MLAKVLELAQVAGIALKILISEDPAGECRRPPPTYLLRPHNPGTSRKGVAGSLRHHLQSLTECKRHYQQGHLDNLLRRLGTEAKKEPQRVEDIVRCKTIYPRMRQPDRTAAPPFLLSAIRRQVLCLPAFLAFLKRLEYAVIQFDF
jgi:hypothetical protein